jgi:putative sterol carrier protein
VLVSGDVLDRMFGGELNVLAALATGQIKTKGDQISAVRLLPVMFALVPLYKAFREQYFAARSGIFL